MASVTVTAEQQSVVKHSGVLSAPGGTVAVVEDERDDDGARGH